MRESLTTGSISIAFMKQCCPKAGSSISRRNYTFIKSLLKYIFRIPIPLDKAIVPKVVQCSWHDCFNFTAI